MLTLLAVGLGGAAGACLRAAITGGINAAIGHRFRHALAVVNILGSFALGVFVTAVDPRLHPLLVTGLCGALTTFSTFAHSAVELLRAGRTAQWLVHSLLHLGGSLIGVTLGQAIYQ